jgi:hypothetical protein
MSTMTLVPRWFDQFARFYRLARVRHGLTRRQRRQAWLDLVATSPHLQHDLGLIDTLPQKHTR